MKASEAGPGLWRNANDLPNLADGLVLTRRRQLREPRRRLPPQPAAPLEGVWKQAGVYSDRGAEKKGKGRQFRTLGFHSLRHTFVSKLANADVPADVRRQISDQNDEKNYERYTHLEVETKRRALAHLQQLDG